MQTEIWLNFNNNQYMIRLPVGVESFELSQSMNNEELNISEIGDINKIGNRKLKTISISSFIPSEPQAYCQYTLYPRPKKFIELIEMYQLSRRPCRLIIKNKDIDINMPVTIDDFKRSQQKGVTDLYFTLELKEYRFIEAKVQNSQPEVSPQSPDMNQRPVEKETPKEYIVKKGDTLIGISKKIYGDSSRWGEIASKNNIKDPRKLQIGQRLVL